MIAIPASLKIVRNLESAFGTLFPVRVGYGLAALQYCNCSLMLGKGRSIIHKLNRFGCPRNEILHSHQRVRGSAMDVWAF